MTTAKVPTRTTTDVTINAEDWRPIRAWLIRADQIDPKRTPPFLFIDHDCYLPLQQFMRRTAKLRGNQDLRLRLPHQAMDAFRLQMRFWESCPDELPAILRADMPNSGYFQTLALEMEAALDESYHPRRTPVVHHCLACRQPVTEQGLAQVHLDAAYVWHTQCATVA